MEKVAAEGKKEGNGEMDPLLGPKPKPKAKLVGNGRGGLAKKRHQQQQQQQQQRGSRRRVQWNDRNGNKLAEVLEFQPSDASDSEDESADYCNCTIM